MKLDARERLIVALDVPSVAEAEALVARLGETVSFYKIGYELAFAGGIDFARVLAGAGKRIFLDLKLHDIGNTVARGVESVARLGASFLTVHAYPQTMHAAVDARKGSPLRLLAVTVLTSYDDADLAAAGYDFTVSELVGERAALPRGRSLLKSPARCRRDREVEMAKGYWIPHIDVSDPEGYKAYMAATPAAHDKYRGHALVRGGAQQVVEGRSRSRNVLREFPDY